MIATLRLALRMLVRDWRAGELTVLAAALVLAVASMGTVGFFADRVKTALTLQANLLLGADVVISSDRPLPDALAADAAKRGLLTVPVVRFNSMVQRESGEGGLVLATVKAVGPGYPLRGAVTLVDAERADGRRADAIPARGEVWPDTRFAQRLGFRTGDRLSVGETVLTVGPVILQEPEVATGILSSGPRLLMHQDDVAATNLLQPGNRATYRLLVADRAGRDALAGYVTWAQNELKPGQRLENVRDVQPEVRQTLERAERFLGLAALVAVMLAAVAVALAASRYLRRHLDTAAMLRCLGTSQRRALALFVAAVRRAGHRRQRGRRRAGAGGAGAAGGAAGVDRADDAAAARGAAGRRRVRRRHAAAAGVRAAAAGRAGRRAAAARAAPRPAAAAAVDGAGLRAGRRGDRAADRVAGEGSDRGRDHGRRDRRPAGRVGAVGVAADPAVEAPAAARRHLALRPRQPAPAPAGVEPAGRRAGAGADGAAAAHRRARRPDEELAREPAGRRAEPLRHQRAAGPGRRRAHVACAGDRRRGGAVPDGPRAARRGERGAARQHQLRQSARAAARRARVQSVDCGDDAVDQPVDRGQVLGGRREARGRRFRWRTASPSRCG